MVSPPALTLIAGILDVFVAQVAPVQVIVLPAPDEFASVKVGFTPGNVNCTLVLELLTTMPEAAVTVIPPPAVALITAAKVPDKVHVLQVN